MLRLFGVTLALWGVIAIAGGNVGDSIKQVKAEHEDRLLAIPGVVSIGIGLDSNGDEAIVIGLEKIGDKPNRQLPKELNGYPVIVQELGTISVK